jgi:hypothetical protein
MPVIPDAPVCRWGATVGSFADHDREYFSNKVNNSFSGHEKYSQ